jgi:putative alpha-1,2-mannosidase
VLAALGLYHVAPGTDAWELSSPLFPQASLRGLTINAPGAGNARPYVHGVQLNGTAHNRTFLTTCQLRTGGKLDFSLGPLADHHWGTGPGAAPPSQTTPTADVERCAASLAGTGPA